MFACCGKFSLYKFLDFLEKRFCHHSLSCQFFATKPFVYTPCYTHNKIFSFGRSLGTFGVLTTTTFWGKIFPTDQPCSSVLYAVATAVGKWLWVWSGFPCTNGRSEDSSFNCHVLYIKGGIVKTFRLVFWLVSPSVVLLGSSKELPPFLLFVSVISQLRALLLTFLPPHNSSEPNKMCSRENQASKDAKLRLSGWNLLRSKLPVQSDFSSPYHKQRTIFPSVSHRNMTWLRG